MSVFDLSSSRLAQRYRLLRCTGGAQLLEFALTLPLLLILLVGISDFAVSFNTKQILNNAAREGARIGAAQPISDLTQTNPASVGVIRDAVVDYLSGAGINPSFISSAPTSAAGCPTCTWTYYSSGTNGLKVERNVQVATSGGPTMMSTRVTLTYPYNWAFGFNRVIKLAIPSADYGSTITIGTDAVMTNVGAF